MKKTEISGVKKVYPIQGRKDFFKYMVTDQSIFDENAKPCIDAAGREMYFDDKKRANDIAKSRNKVSARLKKNN
jgi:hypothetical protein